VLVERTGKCQGPEETRLRAEKRAEAGQEGVGARESGEQGTEDGWPMDLEPVWEELTTDGDLLMRDQNARWIRETTVDWQRRHAFWKFERGLRAIGMAVLVGACSL